jgi:hypothetical protein
MTAGDPPEEPIAGKPHDGICGGESQQWLSYPTFVRNCTVSRMPVTGRPWRPFTNERLRKVFVRTTKPGDFPFKTPFQNWVQRAGDVTVLRVFGPGQLRP